MWITCELPVNRKQQPSLPTSRLIVTNPEPGQITSGLPTTRSWRRWRGLAALLVGAIARSSDDFPMPVEHAPSINDDAFLVEVPAVKSTNPIAFGSDDCEIAIDSGGPVEVSRRVLLFNC